VVVRTTPEANNQALVIDEWWRRNRTAAPDLFLDELETAFRLIGDAPYVGHPYRRSPIAGTASRLKKPDIASPLRQLASIGPS